MSVGVGPFYKFYRVLDLPGGKPVKEFLRRGAVAILEPAELLCHSHEGIQLRIIGYSLFLGHVIYHQPGSYWFPRLDPTCNCNIAMAEVNILDENWKGGTGITL
jgi:hypothetical protein